MPARTFPAENTRVSWRGHGSALAAHRHTSPCSRIALGGKTRRHRPATTRIGAEHSAFYLGLSLDEWEFCSTQACGAAPNSIPIRLSLANRVPFSSHSPPSANPIQKGRPRSRAQRGVSARFSPFCKATALDDAGRTSGTSGRVHARPPTADLLAVQIIVRQVPRDPERCFGHAALWHRELLARARLPTLHALSGLDLLSHATEHKPIEAVERFVSRLRRAERPRRALLSRPANHRVAPLEDRHGDELRLYDTYVCTTKYS
ncbi:hypothetical protein OE88DRAFT_1647405 [Heliocybe sulcata]|uniref:Uncharacterized protein n=1 Tax=Heliocybe sulcata TaxID=5364 RepID=A0A5C3MSK4_9AGAM|nr:hypothetical protein OE88DRAFT_1647405 [Heliocybe sulcata]